MTCRELLAMEHPENVGAEFIGGCVDCPSTYGYMADPDSCNGIDCPRPQKCAACWDREIPEADSIPIPEGAELNPDKNPGICTIKDSGDRTEFATGAVRDIQKGKGRCDLMPLEVVSAFFQDSIFVRIEMFKQDNNTLHLHHALESFARKAYDGAPYSMFLEVAKHFEEGAEKYGENNWQKGLPAQCYINSAVRHYLKWLRGDKDEPHDRAFVWNLMCCIWEVDYSPRAKEKADAENCRD